MRGPAMSNDGSTSASQTPQQELLDRLVEQSPSLGMPRLVGIDHLQSMLADARNRVKDSHRVQMKALGEKPEELAKGDDMGINVAGDTNITIHTPPASPSAASPPPVAGPNEGTTMLKKALPLLGGLAAGLLPTAGFFLARYLDKPTSVAPPPSAASPADSEYEVLFFDRDGNPITVPHISTRKPE